MHWKKPYGQTCKHGLTIWLVDGSYVRNKFDSDFTQGGNGYRYRFISKKELWVDAHIPEAEWPFVLVHECIEVEKMKNGMDYERAHDVAKRYENKLRRALKPGQ